MRERDIPDNSSLHKNRACYEKSFGNDNLFNTGGIIVDLSPDQRYVSESFRNMTLNVPSDHDDLVVTLLDTVFAKSGRQKPPTARLGYNLFALIEDIVNDSVDYGRYNKLSISATHLNFEARNLTFLTRSSTGSSKNSIAIREPSYPTCIEEKNERLTVVNRKHSYEFGRAKRRINFLNYLTVHNRLFSEKFSAPKCVADPLTLEGMNCEHLLDT